MDLDAADLERDARQRHVQTPRARPPLAHLRDGAVPAPLEVAAPLTERPRVVLAQVLAVAHLEAVIVHRADHRARTLELTVGKDVAVEERPGAVALAVRGPGDRVVEDASLGTELAGEGLEVAAELGTSDVLHGPRRGDRVEARLLQVAVVEVADLGPPLESGLADRALRPRHLLGRQRDSQRVHAVVLGRVPHERTPAR